MVNYIWKWLFIALYVFVAIIFYKLFDGTTETVIKEAWRTQKVDQWCKCKKGLLCLLYLVIWLYYIFWPITLLRIVQAKERKKNEQRK